MALRQVRADKRVRVWQFLMAIHYRLNCARGALCDLNWQKIFLAPFQLAYACGWYQCPARFCASRKTPRTARSEILIFVSWAAGSDHGCAMLR